MFHLRDYNANYSGARLLELRTTEITRWLRRKQDIYISESYI